MDERKPAGKVGMDARMVMYTYEAISYLALHVTGGVVLRS